MKYIAVFDIPDGYGMGCAVAKICPKDGEIREEKDFENAYAQIEPLSEEKAEVFEKYNTVQRVMNDLGISCACDMPSFWTNDGKDYKVIPTKFHQGYMKALEDVEKETRKRFGFAERENVVMAPPFILKEEEEMTDTAKKIRALCCGIIEMIDYDDLVTQLPSCNDCAKRDCPHKPKLGDTVRINCFDWEGKEEEDAMS